LNKLYLPVEAWMLDQPVGCSGCSSRATFTLRQFQDAGADIPPDPAILGWQLRLIGTEVSYDGEQARAWRWDLFCPGCAGEASPQPQGSIRIRGPGTIEGPGGLRRPRQGRRPD
jgi:hypothetical protein